MAWDVEFTDEFEEWWHGLTITHQRMIPLADQLYDEHLIELAGDNKGGKDG